MSNASSSTNESQKAFEEPIPEESPCSSSPLFAYTHFCTSIPHHLPSTHVAPITDKSFEHMTPPFQVASTTLPSADLSPSILNSKDLNPHPLLPPPTLSPSTAYTP
jgi:hypothetical protein